MALPILDGNQTAATLSTVLTSGEHIPAHTVVSLGSVAISNITSAVSGSVVSVSNFPSTQTIAGAVTANLSSTNLNAVTIGVRGTVTVGNTVTIAGVVTSGLTGRGTLGDQYPVGVIYHGESEVLNGGRLSVAITDLDGRAYGDAGNSNFPISGTVTANVSNPVRLIGSNGDPIDDGGTLVVNVNDVASLPPISGTVTIGNTVTIASLPNGALTTRFGSVTTANTAQITSAVTNTNRKYLLAQNISAGTVTIGIGFSPTTTQGIQLTAGGGLTFDAFCPTGAVYWLGAVTGANYCLIEG